MARLFRQPDVARRSQHAMESSAQHHGDHEEPRKDIHKRLMNALAASPAHNERARGPSKNHPKLVSIGPVEVVESVHGCAVDDAGGEELEGSRVADVMREFGCVTLCVVSIGLFS